MNRLIITKKGFFKKNWFKRDFEELNEQNSHVLDILNDRFNADNLTLIFPERLYTSTMSELFWLKVYGFMEKGVKLKVRTTDSNAVKVIPIKDNNEGAGWHEVFLEYYNEEWLMVQFKPEQIHSFVWQLHDIHDSIIF